MILTWKPDSISTTEAKCSGSCLSAHTRQVADMMGLSEMPKGVVVCQVWWD